MKNNERHRIEPSQQTDVANRPNIIFNLTRCCTEACGHCAVSALYGKGVEGCSRRAFDETKAGRELGRNGWMLAVDKLLDGLPEVDIDLSGGDCLALPWVRHDFLPWLLGRLPANNVAVTAPATSLDVWLKELAGEPNSLRPGSVHITLDGHSCYSRENLALAQRVMDQGMDLHAECPISLENIAESTIRATYTAATIAGVSGITLIRFFPVGRGAHASGRKEPTERQYTDAIHTWKRVETSEGPRVKLQCSLRAFSEPCSDACKMGPAAWCAMPDGTMLACPWAYGPGGSALHSDLVIGDIRTSSVGALLAASEIARKRAFSRCGASCPVMGYAMTQNMRIKKTA